MVLSQSDIDTTLIDMVHRKGKII